MLYGTWDRTIKGERKVAELIGFHIHTSRLDFFGAAPNELLNLLRLDQLSRRGIFPTLSSWQLLSEVAKLRDLLLLEVSALEPGEQAGHRDGLPRV
jgi:hypothetical protein